MNTAVSFNNKERRLTERRSINFRRRSAERRNATHRSEASQQPANKHNLVLELLVSVLAGVLGIGVLFLTGLFSGASSIIPQIILVVTIVLAYRVALRSAIYS